jgi:rare lipoprotein A (peptidoglycan hydrolase)
MKKLWLFLALIFTLQSCASDHKSYKKYKKYGSSKNTISKFSQNGKKFSHRIKPSESMHAGIKRQAIVNNFTTKSDVDDEISEILDENGKYVGQYKVGNPYEIEGVTYYPQEYESYEEVGVSSWYGDDFHGKKTSNGETYNLRSITAAHQTLPLPSMVRITNLENNKNMIVRVNDRGPFAKERIIDVSEKVAEELGYKDQGTTTVKVEFLQEETEDLLKQLGIAR